MENIKIKDFTDEINLKANGVYMITHKNTDVKYIGSTFTKNGFAGRWRSHISGLRRGIGNVVLLNICNKYGIDGFRFHIIEIIEDINIVRDRERYWIDYYNTYNNGANVSLDTYFPLKNYKHRPYTEEDKFRLMLSSPNKKKVYLYNLEGILLYIFPSSGSCDRFLGLKKGRTNWTINHPIRTLCGKYCATHNVMPEGWSPNNEIRKSRKERALKVASIRKKNNSYYMDDVYKNKIRLGSAKRIQVKLTDLDGNTVKIFNSLNECDDYLGITRGTTSKVLKGKAKTLRRKYIPIKYDNTVLT